MVIAKQYFIDRNNEKGHLVCLWQELLEIYPQTPDLLAGVAAPILSDWSNCFGAKNVWNIFLSGGNMSWLDCMWNVCRSWNGRWNGDIGRTKQAVIISNFLVPDIEITKIIFSADHSHLLLTSLCFSLTASSALRNGCYVRSIRSSLPARGAGRATGFAWRALPFFSTLAIPGRVAL